MAKKFLNGIDNSGQRGLNFGDPSTGTDAANKQYVDNVARGINWKEPVRAASTANVTIASALVNSSSMDGVTLATGERVLLKNQSSAAENGIYLVAASGAASRALDADGAGELKPGSAVLVTEGTANGDKAYIITSDTAITIGSTSITWGQFGGGATYTAGDGLALSGNDFNVGAGTGITVDATNVNIDTSVVVRKYSANIGNASATDIAVTHSLGSKDFTYSVRTVSDDSIVDCDVVATSTSVATFTFASAPATNAYRVTIHV